MYLLSLFYISLSHVSYCSVIVYLQQERGGKGDFEEETTPNEDVDKFCVELYQGSKLLGQKQVVSKFLPHRKKHNSVMVRQEREKDDH